ncbi:MAG: hypothetical protein MUO60_03000 [Clostridiaceae bacterium]|nr:hypothetical protein [Clostridiaceae bacterium]
MKLKEKIIKTVVCSKCGKALKVYEKINKTEGEKVTILCRNCMWQECYDSYKDRIMR